MAKGVLNLIVRLMERVARGDGGIVRAVALGWMALGYLTPHKVRNILLCEIEKHRRVVRPRALPYIAILDVMNACNLRCPFCPTGNRRDSGRPLGGMDVSIVRRLLDELGDELVCANLFNWGEPLLHPEIAGMVRMIRRRGIMTSLSTNLSLDRPEVLRQLCDARLDHVIVSVSGARQETHERYHRGSRLERVLANLRLLTEYKNRQGFSRPFVEVKYLVFKHNLNEIDRAAELFKEAGADFFRHVRAGGAEEAIVDRGEAPEREYNPRFCDQLWNHVVVNADGGVPGCCYLFFKEDDFGHVSQDRLMDLRANDVFTTARRFFNSSATAGLPPDLRHPCLKCEMVHSQPHLRQYLAANPRARKGHRTGGP